MITTEQVQLKKNEMVTGNISNLNNKVNRIINILNNSDQVFSIVKDPLHPDEITAKASLPVASEKVTLYNDQIPRINLHNSDLNLEGRMGIGGTYDPELRLCNKVYIGTVEHEGQKSNRLAIGNGYALFNFDKGIIFNVQSNGEQDNTEERHGPNGWYKVAEISTLTGLITDKLTIDQRNYYTDQQKDTLVPSYLYCENHYLTKKNFTHQTIISDSFLIKGGLHFHGEEGVQLFRDVNDPNSSLTDGIYQDNQGDVTRLRYFAHLFITFRNAPPINTNYVKVIFTVELRFYWNEFCMTETNINECINNFSLLALHEYNGSSFSNCYINKRIHNNIPKKQTDLIISGEYSGNIIMVTDPEDTSKTIPVIMLLFVTNLPSGQPQYRIQIDGEIHENHSSVDLIDTLSTGNNQTDINIARLELNSII